MRGICRLFTLAPSQLLSTKPFIMYPSTYMYEHNQNTKSVNKNKKLYHLKTTAYTYNNGIKYLYSAFLWSNSRRWYVKLRLSILHIVVVLELGCDTETNDSESQEKVNRFSTCNSISASHQCRTVETFLRDYIHMHL